MDDIPADIAGLSIDESPPVVTPGDNGGASNTNNEVRNDSSFVQQLDELAITPNAVSTSPEALFPPSRLQDLLDSTPGAFPRSAPTTVPRPLQQHICSSSSCAALKVFGTPELLANVLGFLDTRDVMFMRRVNRTWTRTVADTPELRILMFVRPQWLRPAGDYMLLDLKIPGLSIQRGELVHMGQWIEIKISAKAARELCPSGSDLDLCNRRRRAFEAMSLSRSSSGNPFAGTRFAGRAALERKFDSSKVKYEELHITQPPLLGLQAFLGESAVSDISSLLRATAVGRHGENDNDEDSQDTAPCAKISCDSGVNLEFVAQTALALLRIGDDREVVFKAIVSFCDPPQAFRKRDTMRSMIPLSGCGTRRWS